VNVVNGEDNVFTFVCLCVCSQRRDVKIAMTSLHHQQIVCDIRSSNAASESHTRCR